MDQPSLPRSGKVRQSRLLIDQAAQSGVNIQDSLAEENAADSMVETLAVGRIPANAYIHQENIAGFPDKMLNHYRWCSYADLIFNGLINYDPIFGKVKKCVAAFMPVEQPSLQ